MIDWKDNSLSAFLNDRLKDPFLGVYSFFILTYNWKVFLITFSNIDIFFKIEKINYLLKIAHFRSVWFPLILTVLYIVLSSLLKTLTKLFIQTWQRLDNKVLPVAMDDEKINLLLLNSKLISENEKLSKRILEYSHISQSVMYFIAQQAANVATVNNLINRERLPENVAKVYETSHELVNGIENLKSTLKNNIEKDLIKLD